MDSEFEVIPRSPGLCCAKEKQTCGAQRGLTQSDHRSITLIAWGAWLGLEGQLAEAEEELARPTEPSWRYD